VDYKEVLKPEEFEVFSRLRDWRKATADKEGVPVYVVLTNEQLAQMVQKKTNSKAGLKEIEGVGDARVEKYGDALLQILTAQRHWLNHETARTTDGCHRRIGEFAAGVLESCQEQTRQGGLRRL
jgi:ribonuclease D